MARIMAAAATAAGRWHGLALGLALAVGAGAGAGCGKRATGPIDRVAAARLFDQVELAADNGLSDLSVDADGAIWTESERDASVFRVVLDGTRVASITRYAITNPPAATDLEAVTWLGPGKLAFGTESHDDDRAQILLADVDERAHTVTLGRALELPRDRLGLTIQINDGIEGLCGAGDTVIAAIESTGADDAGRWAPLVRVDLRTGAADVTRLALTSDKGKLSAVACTIGPDGAAQLLLIERHFAVTRLLRATLPPPGRAPVPPAKLAPTIALDLGAVLNSALNLEGIGVLRDGRVVAVVDNQYDRITGPDLLLVFKPGAVP